MHEIDVGVNEHPWVHFSRNVLRHYSLLDNTITLLAIKLHLPSVLVQ